MCKNDLFSGHYNIDDFKIIFKIRAKRFLNQIMSNFSVLFVRIENLGGTQRVRK